MSDCHLHLDSKPKLKGRDLAIRRREAKDTLLGDDPPRFLSVAIIIIAAVLGILVVAARSIEYEDAVPILLTLKVSESSDQVYGVAYLRPEEMMKVRTGQLVRVEFGPHQGRDHSSIEAIVSNISNVNKAGLCSVRVDLSVDVIASSGLRTAFEQEMQTQAKVLTQKMRLFDKLFGVLRTLMDRG